LSAVVVTDNYQQILFTENRQETLEHTDKIPTSTKYRQIPTTGQINSDGEDLKSKYFKS